MKPIKKLYVAGPMTGLPDNNRPAFRYAAKRLKDAGFEAVLPPEMDHTDLYSDRDALSRAEMYRKVMPKDIATVAECDALFLLPGFEESTGTGLELHAAEVFQMEAFMPPYQSGMISLEHWIDLAIGVINQHNENITAKQGA